MNGIKYLADTNCFIYLLDENPLLLPFAENGWAYSFITEMELLSKKKISKKEDSMIRQMLSICFKVNHNQHITDLAIAIRRDQGLKLPDAIIAASAQYLQIPLLTADKALARIKGIDCILLAL